MFWSSHGGIASVNNYIISITTVLQTVVYVLLYKFVIAQNSGLFVIAMILFLNIDIRLRLWKPYQNYFLTLLCNLLFLLTKGKWTLIPNSRLDIFINLVAWPDTNHGVASLPSNSQDAGMKQFVSQYSAIWFYYSIIDQCSGCQFRSLIWCCSIVVMWCWQIRWNDDLK